MEDIFLTMTNDGEVILEQLSMSSKPRLRQSAVLVPTSKKVQQICY